MNERELELWLGEAIAEKSVNEFDEGKSSYLAASGIQQFESAGLQDHGLIFWLADGSQVIIPISIVPSEADSASLQMKISKDEELMKVSEIAEILDLPKRTIYHYINKGYLSAMKVGGDLRVFRKDLEEFASGSSALEDDSIPDNAMDLKEISGWLRFHPEHVRRMTRENGLPVHKTPRTKRLYFYKNEVLSFLRKQNTA